MAKGNRPVHGGADEALRGTARPGQAAAPAPLFGAAEANHERTTNSAADAGPGLGAGRAAGEPDVALAPIRRPGGVQPGADVSGAEGGGAASGGNAVPNMPGQVEADLRLTVDRVDRLALRLSLKSRVCPMCGGPKKPGHSLCYGDFGSLPKSFQDALYQRFGQGYEGAIVDAFARMNKTLFHMRAAAGGGRKE